MAAGKLDFPSNDGYSLTRSSRAKARKESGSAFDATVMDNFAPVGTHTRAKDDDLDLGAFTTLGGTSKTSPKTFLRRGEGMGGTLRPREMTKEEKDEAELAAKIAGVKKTKPRKQRATSKRSNPANTDFRRFFEAGSLPVNVSHTSTGIRAGWTLHSGTLADLDYHFFLPVFMSGLREVEEPYQGLALHGTMDLLEAAPSKVVKCIPQLAVPIHEALTTRDPRIIRRVLLVLQAMVKEGAEHGVGEALVPYFRQILPILNIFKEANESTGDMIVYGQRKQECLGDLINETLQLLEIYGGELAFVNIRYFIPTYESAVVAVTTAPEA